MNAVELGKIFEPMARAALRERRFAGVVIRVERGGEPVYVDSFGNAVETRDRAVPMTQETLFDIASLTKIFTTTIVLRLATIGKFDIQDALCDTALSIMSSPRRTALHSVFKKTRIVDLLTHSSGLHYWYPFYADDRSDCADILEYALDRWPLSKTPVYSDLNFILLGKLVELSSGKRLDEALCDFVTVPLGLASTRYLPRGGNFAATEFGNKIEKKMVADLGMEFGGWRPDERAIEGEADDGNCHYFFRGVAGHAGIFSTVRDACALGNLYLGRGPEGYIKSDLLEIVNRDFGGGRGLGFQLGELYPGGGFGHTGFTGTYLYLDRATDISMAVFANRLHVEAPGSINDFRARAAAALREALRSD